MVQHWSTWQVRNKGFGDGKYSSDTIYHETRGYNPVQHSHVSYHESKPSESGTLSTGFALP